MWYAAATNAPVIAFGVACNSVAPYTHLCEELQTG